MTDERRIVLNRWSVFNIDHSTGLREAGHRHIKQFPFVEMHARDLRSGLVCVCVCVCVCVPASTPTKFTTQWFLQKAVW